jgi:hypothetical protein
VCLMSRAFPRGCPWTASPLCEQRAVDEVALFAFSGALVDPMGVVAQEDPRARPAHTWPSPILRLALVALSLIRPAEQGRRSTKSPPRPWSNDRVGAAEASEPLPRRGPPYPTRPAVLGRTQLRLPGSVGGSGETLSSAVGSRVAL